VKGFFIISNANKDFYYLVNSLTLLSSVQPKNWFAWRRKVGNKQVSRVKFGITGNFTHIKMVYKKWR
jgi:hypothetical protein